MKVRIKKTGEVVNLASYATITLEQCDSWGNPIEMKPEEVELVQEPTEDEHWQDVRERAAIAAMQCILPVIYRESDTFDEETVARHSAHYADALVEQLKK